MILLLSNREDVTTDLVVLELRRRGLDFVRFNTEDFPLSASLSVCFDDGSEPDGLLEIKGRRIKLEEIGAAWYRRPVAPTYRTVSLTSPIENYCKSEALWTLAGTWANLRCFWVSKPWAVRRATDKLYQLKVAKGLGFQVPTTLVSNEPHLVRQFYTSMAARNRAIVAKPVRRGFVPGSDWVVFTTLLTRNDLAAIEGLRLAPMIFQEYITKAADVRVTVVGQKVFAAAIVYDDPEKAPVDWRASEGSHLIHQPWVLPGEVQNKCRALVETMDLAFGAIDLVLDPNGRYFFLEINPNGQWAWLEKQCGFPLTSTLVDLLVTKDRSVS
ncbi:MAG: hypothetical protein QHH27_01745 [Clostridia bacterium]|jgi:glutathione synthase/RimK-type ligase-like ATP-grasp enzyme|nr:hypothetical protein [Clostridia bacterium]MDH7572260.1 hypothetical protein [Clostridia bacterium]